jgi:tetratricopeptide (TPR) repeat protein
MLVEMNTMKNGLDQWAIAPALPRSGVGAKGRWLLFGAMVTILGVGGWARPGLAVSVPMVLAQNNLAQNDLGQETPAPNPVDAQLQQLVQQVTVQVITPNNRGSGTLLAKRENTYLVLTNRHVVRDGAKIELRTADGQRHVAKLVENGFQDQSDLALLEFTSTTPYQVPTIGEFTPKPGLNLLSAGYAAESGQLELQSSQLKSVLSKPLKEGYELGYGGTIQQGMSGGPIFEQGTYELIGINGRMAFPLLPNYEYADGQQPTPAEQEQLRPLNWGVPIQRVLQQVQPQLLIAYDLPAPESAEITTASKSVGFVAELEAKAKQFTVRIDGNCGDNGSGVIIGQQGKTYTVLTANHVVTPSSTTSCQSTQYSVLTPDGQQIAVTPKTIQREEGVDLALLEFESDAAYAVAVLGNYRPSEGAPVFAAGFPKLSGQADWQFNGGVVLEREQGILTVAIRLGNSEQSAAQASVGFSGGYEMVYTSITHGGMSGGPVLDLQGRVMGIHGLAEGESRTGSVPIQLGYSLGIPTNTVMGMLAKRPGGVSRYQVSTEMAASVTGQEIKDFQASVVNVEIPPGNAPAEVWINRGNQLWRVRRYDDAIAAFEKALERPSEYDYLALYGIGLVQIDSGSILEAIATLNQAIQKNREYIPAYKNLAAAYRLSKDYEQALSTINQAIQLQPEDANGWNEKWVILYSLKRYEEALEAINRAIALSKRPAFYMNRGTVYAALKRYEGALADYTQAIALDPNYVNAYYNRGTVYRDQKRYEEALAEYNQAIALDPNYVGAYNNRGTVYSDLKRYEEALAEYTQAIALDPNFVYAYYNRGTVYYDLKRYEEALAEYTQAIALDPNYVDAYNNRANVYYDQKLYEEAIADYNKAIALAPELAEAFFNRGLVYIDLGNPEQAKKDLLSAAQLFQQQGRVADYEKAMSILSQL